MEKNNRQAQAFFDAEYTCPTGNELLSAGLVICDSEGHELDRLYRQVKPVNCYISPFCTKLTGIRQADADKGLPYGKVMEEIYNLIRRYRIKRISVWGNDATVIRNDFERHHSDLPAKTASKINWIISHLRDVSSIYSHRLDLSLTSLEKMKYVCALDGPVRHHALGDAVDLKNIAFAIDQGTYNTKRRDLLRQYMKEHSRYNSTKRFSANSSLPPSDRSSRNAALQYLKTLDDRVPELRALHDDLCYIHGIKKIKGFPSFKEYAQKHAPNI